MNLSEILGSLKRDKKGKKKVMEHHQTVALPRGGSRGRVQGVCTPPP